MTKWLLLLSLVLLVSCGHRMNNVPGETLSIENMTALSNTRAGIRQWAPRCNGYACTDESDGDAMLWMGALCLSGEVDQCSGVAGSQSSDGRLWRSVGRVGVDDVNSFSRDMLLGYISYVIATSDRTSATAFINYTHRSGYKLCPRSTDNRCDVNYIQYRGIWGLLKRTWSHIGLRPTAEMLQADLGDDTAIAAALDTSTAGYTRHLAMYEVFLRQRLESTTNLLENAASRVANDENDNPFYRYVTHADPNTTADLLIAQCPTEKPSSASQWAWQRASMEQAWHDSMGWDCIFMINLLIGAAQ